MDIDRLIASQMNAISHLQRMNHRVPFTLMALMSLVLFAPACTSRQDLVWQSADGYKVAKLQIKRSGKAGFARLLPAATGIDFVNRLTRAQIDSNQVLLDGSGVAIGDVDGDGWADIYFARLHGPNVLYRNLGDWTFDDITAEADVALAIAFLPALCWPMWTATGTSTCWSPQ